MTPQSSLKHVYSLVTTTVDRAEETPAEKAHTQSTAACCSKHTASASELLMERVANVLCTALEFSVLVLLLVCCGPPSNTHPGSQQQLPHSAKPLLPPWPVYLSDPNIFEQQQPADQTWVQQAVCCLQIRSAPLNQKQLLNLNQKIDLLSLHMWKVTTN